MSEITIQVKPAKNESAITLSGDAQIRGMIYTV